MSGAYRVLDDVIAVRVGDEVVLWVESTRSLHLLDQVATAVWDCLDVATEEEAVSQLSARFTASPDQVRQDVRALVARLQDQSVLRPSGTR